MEYSQDDFKNLAIKLGRIREDRRRGSVESFASDFGVSAQKIRNFEHGKSHDMNLMLYYYYRIYDPRLEPEFINMINTETRGWYDARYGKRE